MITGLAAAFVTSLGDDHPANVAGRGRWLVRAITSLLIFPGRDEADERAMLTEFVAPVVVPADTGQSRTRVNRCSSQAGGMVITTVATNSPAIDPV